MPNHTAFVRRRLCLLLAMLLAGAFSMHNAHVCAQTLDLGEDDGMGELFDDFEAAVHGDKWWDEAWQYRLPVWTEDPDMLLQKGRPVYLNMPDPLLLYNTGRAQHGLTDLRAITQTGQSLPCGVVRFGRDTGDSAIWVQAPSSLERVPFKFTLYYGNPSAEPTKYRNDPGDLPISLIDVHVLPEETKPGAQPATRDAQAFFDNLVVYEFEDMIGPDGRLAVAHEKYEEPHFILVGREHTSGNGYVAPTIPWRPGPIEGIEKATGTITIPSAGQWRMHVRFLNSEYNSSQHGHAPNKLRNRMYPFELQIGDQTFTVGQDQSKGPTYRWQSYDVTFPKGELPIELRFEKLGGADCLILTKDPDYLPDYRDVAGPVWMRFKMVGDDVPPHIVDFYNVHTPWSSHGPQGDSAGFAFADRVLPTRDDAYALTREEEAPALKGNQWTPWMQAMQARMPSWWINARFMQSPIGGRPRQIGDHDVAFEFATRPTQGRVFRRGQEPINANGLMVIMPEALDLNEVLRRTLSFRQWADERLASIKALGIEPVDGPKQIPMATSARVYSDQELIGTINILDWLGFNTMNLTLGGGERDGSDVETLVKTHANVDKPSTMAFHWMLSNDDLDFESIMAHPSPGQSYKDRLIEVLREGAARRYSPPEEGWTYGRKNARILVMGDEIGPFISSPWIEAIPLMRGYFVEYLKSHDLTPQFFGAETWEQVKPLDFGRVGKYSRGFMEQIDPTWKPENELANEQLAEEMLTEGLTRMEGTPIADGDLDTMEALDEAAALIEEAKGEATLGDLGDREHDLYETRRYVWTQNFRSHYTTLNLGISSDAIDHSVEVGHFTHRPFASPNFQAMPAQKGTMWDGALNLFEIARDDGLDYILLEDWTWNPYKAAFGTAICRAAARKRGQPLGALVTGGSPQQRFVADLGQGARAFYSYLYGPLRVIGPPWAEHLDSVEWFARLNRWMGNLEPELMAVAPRDAEAAILVGNTMEKHSLYFNWKTWERQAVFAALADSHVPVEAVGEEEILEDDALSRYKVLYVVDPHVDSRVQEKLKAWVQQGGVLWASYAGLAFEEYNARTDRFNEVFGLADRGDVVERQETWGEDNGPTVTISTGGPLLPATFATPHVQPDYKLSTGQALAQFEDGSPAIVHNRFGNGEAYLVGFPAITTTAGYRQEIDEPEDAPAKRLITALPAKKRVTPHATTTAARTMAFMSDGQQDGQPVSMLFVIHCLDQPQHNVTIDVTLPTQPTQVYDADGNNLPFEKTSDGVRLTLNLEVRDVKMVVFK